jgi:hypothetical protein
VDQLRADGKVTVVPEELKRFNERGTVSEE